MTAFDSWLTLHRTVVLPSCPKEPVVAAKTPPNICRANLIRSEIHRLCVPTRRVRVRRISLPEKSVFSMANLRTQGVFLRTLSRYQGHCAFVAFRAKQIGHRWRKGRKIWRLRTVSENSIPFETDASLRHFQLSSFNSGHCDLWFLVSSVAVISSQMAISVPKCRTGSRFDEHQMR